MDKSENAYKTISEVVEIIGLKSKKGKLKPTHTLRYWEKEFNQIKPRILKGSRRYYDEKNIELLKKIHFLLKDRGMTINGVKKFLKNKETLELDEISNRSISKLNIRNKVTKISNLVKKQQESQKSHMVLKVFHPAMEKRHRSHINLMTSVNVLIISM